MKRSVLFRLLSMLLVFAMLVELLPAGAFAAPAEEDDYLPPAQAEAVPDEPAESEATAEAETPDPAVLGEMTELREENVKHFRMEDGTFTAVAYDQPVHYEDADGKWQDIDNTLFYQAASDAEKATYKTGPGSFGASFDETITEDGRIFETEDGAVSLFLDMEANHDPLLQAAEEPSETGDPIQGEEIQQENDSAENGAPVEESVSSTEVIISDADSSVKETATDEDEVPAEDVTTEEENLPDENLPAEDSILPENTESSEEQLVAPGSNQDSSQEDTLPLPAASFRAEIQPVSDARDATNKYTAFAPGAQRSEIIYRGILPEIDLRYEINALSIKESIIVDAPCEEYVYGFRLLLDGLTPTMDDAGAISLKDSAGIEQYYIPACGNRTVLYPGAIYDRQQSHLFPRSTLFSYAA